MPNSLFKTFSISRMNAGTLASIVILLLYGSSFLFVITFPSNVRLVGVTKSYTIRDWGSVLSAIAVAFVGLNASVPFSRLFSATPRPRNHDSNIRIPDYLQWILILFSIFLIACTIIDKTITELLARDYYQDKEGHIGTGPLRFADPFLILIPMIVGTVSSASRSGSKKIVAGFLFFACIALEFAMCSRKLPLAFLSLLFGEVLVTSSRPSSLKLFLCVLASSVSLPAVLFLRDGEVHGLLPYFNELVFNLSLDDIGIAFEKAISNQADIFVTLDATIVDYHSPRRHELYTAMSPLPGSMTDWGQISPSLRIHLYTPYSSIGELWCHGPIIEFLYFAFISVAIFFNERLTSKIVDSSIPSLVGRAVLIGAIVMMPQYNLRSITRFVYFAIAAPILISFGIRLLMHIRSRSDGSARSLRDWS